MRIAFNASIVDPILSGLGVYAVNLLRELAQLHADLAVYTSSPELCRVDSGRVRRISRAVQPRRGLPGHFSRIVWIETVLPIRLLASRASVLLSPLPEGLLLPVVPQVVVVHDLVPLRFAEAYPRRQYWNRYYFRYLVPLVLRRSVAIIADSESTRQDVMAFYRIEPDRIHVVPAGYDRQRFRSGIGAGPAKEKFGLERYLLYVGNLLPHKNLRGLLQAFAVIARKFPHKLVIAGRKDPRYYPALEAETEAAGLKERVVFLDYVQLDELPALYAGADAFVLPSLYEGFGLPALEAMACGTPVIASHVGSIREVTGDTALLFDPRDVQEIADAMAAVLGDPSIRAVMSRRGVERAEEYSWKRTARTVLGIIQAVVHR